MRALLTGLSKMSSPACVLIPTRLAAYRGGLRSQVSRFPSFSARLRFSFGRGVVTLSAVQGRCQAIQISGRQPESELMKPFPHHSSAVRDNALRLCGLPVGKMGIFSRQHNNMKSLPDQTSSGLANTLFVFGIHGWKVRMPTCAFHPFDSLHGHGSKTKLAG